MVYDLTKIERIEAFDDRRHSEGWGVIVWYRAPHGLVRLPFFYTDELGALLRMEQYNHKKETL